MKAKHLLAVLTMFYSCITIALISLSTISLSWWWALPMGLILASIHSVIILTREGEE
jgi:type II secretory pathway component PulF